MYKISQIIIVSTIFFFTGCQQNNSDCNDILPGIGFAGKGYIIYDRSSQDAVREFYFFPSCESGSPPVKDSTFINEELRSGVSFQLPLTGNIFKQISVHSYKFIDRYSSNHKPAFFCPVFIELDSLKNSNSQYSAKRSDEYWKFYLAIGDKHIQLNYFISNDCVIRKIDFL